MLGPLSLFIIFFLLIIVYLYKCAKERPENFPPGPPRLPVYGSYWFLLKQHYKMVHLSLDFLRKQYKTDILGFYLGPYPTVVTFSNELSKEMLSRDEFIGRVDTILGRTRSRGEPRGIFLTDGPIWKQHRRFSLRQLRDYGFGRRSEVIENFATDEIKRLLNFLCSEPKEEDMDICKKKGQVLIPDFLDGSLLNIVLLVLTSTQYNHKELREYARVTLRIVKSGDATGGALVLTPWLRFLAPEYFGYTSALRDNGILLQFLETAVNEHLKTFSDDHHRDLIDDYISATIEQGFELDRNQLLLVVLDYMFATPVGLGLTLGFYFVHLINNPHVQVKLQEEIDRVVGRSRLPHLDDRKDMPYFEATSREVLRITPVIPLGVPRRCLEDTTLGGYFIPKNTIMYANMWAAHRDERVFKNPEEFQPSRFLDEDGNLLKKDNTITFGAGKRLCAGETFARNNMFLFMSSILQNFSLKSTTGKPIDLNIIGGVALSLKDTWMVTVPR